MATEMGKRLWETVGVATARMLGREVPAPAGPDERDALAALLVAEARRSPAHARELAALMRVAGTGGGAQGVPRQLPTATRHFTDRKRPLALLDREADRKPDGLPKVAVLHGPEGIGTSSVAYRWGCGTKRFPDGTLYMDLRSGSVSTAPTAATVLREFLPALGVPESSMPLAVDERLNRYRGLLADRRMLVVLDHAQSAAQVSPLITGAPGVFTVVVARRPLTGLDAVTIPVEPLSDKDARSLLTHLVGSQAMKAARGVLPAFLEDCAGNPFVLRARAEQLTSGPPVGRRTNEVNALSPVRAAVDEAYGRLAPDAARLYRLCALRPWSAFGAGAAGVAAGVEEPEARRLLAELAESHLLEGTGDGRFRYRPAVRAHAQDIAAREDGVAGSAASVRRTVDWYLRFAVQADFAALEGRWHVSPLFERLGKGDYADPGAAIAALAAESGNLVEAVLAAEEFGFVDLACPLVEALWALQLKTGCGDALMPALRAGVRIADENFPGSRTAGRMHVQLAFAYMDSMRDSEAESELRTAADVEALAAHPRGQATAVESLGLLRLRQWQFQPALECFEEADRALDRIGPGDEGADDLPRARALLQRHRGRALIGLSQFGAARQRLDAALEYFQESSQEAYNTARVLTDLAELLSAEADFAAALPLIDRATALLREENATAHLTYLAGLRDRCAPYEQ
ncbi:tetratricopeptide repeat protein [Kitasatospora sp. NPDC051170]|uniref:tetratricopeptide repeat protein n=1 Tax=Kitasatospora sp. NPDC051170 TaxID=3364056 RepID=UPI00379CD797